MSASYRTIVDVLNRDGHKPKRARKWSPMTVKRIYDRETKQATPPAADTLVTTLMGGPG
jgi:hypothetical protein